MGTWAEGRSICMLQYLFAFILWDIFAILSWQSFSLSLSLSSADWVEKVFLYLASRLATKYISHSRLISFQLSFIWQTQGVDSKEQGKVYEKTRIFSPKMWNVGFFCRKNSGWSPPLPPHFALGNFFLSLARPLINHTPLSSFVPIFCPKILSCFDLINTYTYY